MKTNDGLVAYAALMVGKPYWFGSYGQTATEGLEKRLRADFPRKWDQIGDVSKDYGNKVFDAAGLIKGYIWSNTPKDQPVYKSSEDLTSYGFYRTSKNHGKRDDFPKTNGTLVYKSITNNTIGICHVGVYADGYVYEAVPKEGVVKTPYRVQDWPYWSDCIFIDVDG